MRKWIWILLLTIEPACDQNRVYDTSVEISDSGWAKDDVKRFQFTIGETSSRYNILANFTNARNYPFHNLYYQYQLVGPQGELLKEELVNINLFEPKTGKPNGDGLGDIFDHRQLLLKNYEFPKSGDYVVRLEHHMRRDTVPLVIAVGVRVEKYSKD